MLYILYVSDRSRSHTHTVMPKEYADENTEKYARILSKASIEKIISWFLEDPEMQFVMGSYGIRINWETRQNMDPAEQSYVLDRIRQHVLNLVMRRRSQHMRGSFGLPGQDYPDADDADDSNDDDADDSNDVDADYVNDEHDNELVEPPGMTEQPELEPLEPPATTEPDKARCSKPGCKRRVKISDIVCRCGLKFCPLHKHFSDHDCMFDYKAAHRDSDRDPGSRKNASNRFEYYYHGGGGAY